MIRAVLLGDPAIVYDGVQHELALTKGTALRYFLAIRGGWVARDELLALLWPESDERRARNNLRKLLSRDVAQPYAEGVEATGDRLRWPVESDLRTFERHLDAGRWFEAAAAYGGPLLAGVRPNQLPAFETWLEGERGRLHQAWRGACLQAADGANPIDSAPLLERLHRSDPFDEVVLRRLLRTLVETGQRGRALSVLDRAREQFARDLDGELHPETVALRAELTRAQPVERTLSAIVPRPLPTPTTGMIGRERELTHLKTLLLAPETRLLTLIAPGGMGKTRLALALAADLQNAWEDGVHFVSLAELNDADQIPAAIVGALATEGSRLQPERYLEQLRTASLLLVLDNLEHLPEASEPLSDLLRHAPGVRVLATSRRRIDLRGERLYELDGLGMGSDGTRSAALELLLEAGRRVRHDLTFEHGRLAAAVRICELVGGMPLGLELAAGWFGLLSVDEVAAELELGIDLLETTASDVPDRQRSIRAMFDASWERLTEPERAALARLSVFRGGFDRAAAERVAGAPLTTLRTLSDRALIRHDGGRFHLHELLRQFAYARLERDGGAPETHGRHLVQLLEIFDVPTAPSREAHVVWIGRAERELGNIDAALAWGATSDRIDDLNAALRLAYALRHFWSQTIRIREGVRWHHHLLDRAEALGGVAEATLARACIALATTESFVGAYRDALRHGERALTLAEATGERELIVTALQVVAYLQEMRGRFREAKIHLERGLELARDRGDDQLLPLLSQLGTIAWRLGHDDEARTFLREGLELDRTGNGLRRRFFLYHLGNTALAAGDLDGAEPLHRESLELATAVGDEQHIAWSHITLGRLALARGETDEAERQARLGLALLAPIGDPEGEAHALYVLGRARLLLGDLPTALEHLRASFTLRHTIDNPVASAEALEALAALAHAASQVATSRGHLVAQSARLAAIAATIRARHGSPPPLIDRSEIDRLLAALRETLGDRTFEAAWAEGSNLPLTDAVAQFPTRFDLP